MTAQDRIARHLAFVAKLEADCRRNPTCSTHAKRLRLAKQALALARIESSQTHPDDLDPELIVIRDKRPYSPAYYCKQSALWRLDRGFGTWFPYCLSPLRIGIGV